MVWSSILSELPQILLLTFLGVNVLKRRRYEHLLWICLILSGQIIGLIVTVLNLPAINPPPSRAGFVLQHNLWQSGYLIMAGGDIALIVAVYRSFIVPRLVSQTSASAEDSWPPAPRKSP